MENISGGKFEKGIKTINNYVLKYLVVLLTACIVLGAAHLTYVIIEHLIEPPYAMIEVSTLLEIFSLALIILVGYEMVKSFSIIISSDKIPVTPILQIGLTAVANKIITLDIKHIDVGYLYGIAALALALSASLFLVNFNKEQGPENGKD
jgi:uncharacterized membrane protein (DUF373 family)